MWMHGLLPEFPAQTYSGDYIDRHPKTGAILGQQGKRTKPGHLHTKKIKAVCTGCNNGWMSVIETKAKPSLERLIKGERIVLDQASLLDVARWATLKAIVSEHDKPETHVTPQADRTEFMQDGTIPSYFNLYILSHKCSSRSGYVRTTHTVSLAKDGPVPPLDGRTKNTQQISVILGSIMLHVNAARVDNFRIEDRLSMPAVEALRIWPLNRAPLTWPSPPVLTCEQMGEIAYSMERIAVLPEVRWADLPRSAG